MPNVKAISMADTSELERQLDGNDFARRAERSGVLGTAVEVATSVGLGAVVVLSAVNCSVDVGGLDETDKEPGTALELLR